MPVSDRDAVFVKHRHADIVTSLNCTSKVFTGKDGACKLSVTNAGSAASAQDRDGFGRPRSHSTAYVKIVPRGWWWAF